MKVIRQLSYAAMTPAEVLAVLRDSYRFAEELDPEAEPGVDLRLDTTIDMWRSACDLVGTRALGRAMNK